MYLMPTYFFLELMKQCGVVFPRNFINAMKRINTTSPTSLMKKKRNFSISSVNRAATVKERNFWVATSAFSRAPKFRSLTVAARFAGLIEKVPKKHVISLIK